MISVTSKRLIIVLLVSALYIQLNAQSEETQSIYFFEHFQKGEVYFASGSVVEGEFNYNKVTEQLLFKNDDEVLAIAEPSSIKRVTFELHTFVYAFNEVFLEELKINKQIVYVRHSAKILSQGKSSAYGGYSESGSITNISSTKGSDGRMHDLVINEKQVLKDISKVYIHQKGKWVALRNDKQLVKLLPEKKLEILNYIDSIKVDYTNKEEVIELLDACYNVQ